MNSRRRTNYVEGDRVEVTRQHAERTYVITGVYRGCRNELLIIDVDPEFDEGRLHIEPFYVHWVPSEEQIARECAILQRTWSRREELWRRGVDPNSCVEIARAPQIEGIGPRSTVGKGS